MKLLEGLVTEAVAAAVALGSVIGLAIGGFRSILQAKWGGWAGLLRGLAGAVLVGVGVSLALHSMDLPETMKVAIACGFAYVSDEALQGLRVIGAAIAKDPVEAVAKVIAGLRGKK